MSVTTTRHYQLQMMVPASAHAVGCNMFSDPGEALCDCDVINKHPEAIDQSTLYGMNGERLRMAPLRRLRWAVEWMITRLFK